MKVKIQKFQIGGKVTDYDAIFKGIIDHKNFNSKVDSTLNAKLDSAVAAGNTNFKVSFTGQAPINPLDTMSTGTMQGFNKFLDNKLGTPPITSPKLQDNVNKTWGVLDRMGQKKTSLMKPKINNKPQTQPVYKPKTPGYIVPNPLNK